MVEIKGYKMIKKTKVWEKLKEGKKIKAAVIQGTCNFNSGIYNLEFQKIGVVREMIETGNTIFFEEKEREEKNG